MNRALLALALALAACGEDASTSRDASTPASDATPSALPDASGPADGSSPRDAGAGGTDAQPGGDAGSIGAWMLPADTTVTLEPRAPDGTVRGLYREPNSGAEIRFRVRKTGETSAEAWYSTTTATVQVVLRDRGDATATLFFPDPLEMNGLGVPDSLEAAALGILAFSFDIGLGLRQVPLELGCSQGFYDVELAALVFPYQLLLKYGMLDRTADLRTALDRAHCEYVRDDDAPPMSMLPPRRGLLQLGHEDFFPNVMGFFPLDEEGAYELPHAIDSPMGPCKGKCRGSCGVDCEQENNCDTNKHFECEGVPSCKRQMVTEYSCGLHEGCIEHDGCYDFCQNLWGCGSYLAFSCMHYPDSSSCDGKCFAEYGVPQCVQWALGEGPYTSRQTYTYTSTDTEGGCCMQHPECCTSCLQAGSLVTLADGRRIPIERIQVNDRVAAIDTDTGAPTEADVELVLVHQDGPFLLDRLFMSSGETLDVTANHPIWTLERGYAEVGTLQLGEHLLRRDPDTGETSVVSLVAITREVSSTDVVYNLKTSAHSYVAADILVHNKCVAKGSLVDTPLGPTPIEALRPGDFVYGRDGALSRVSRVFEKETIRGSLPGKRLAPALAVTVNHEVAVEGGYLPAGALPAFAEEVPGSVYDLETSTGEYSASGVILRAAAPGE